MKRLLLVVSVLPLAACYHQVVQAGVTPGLTVIEKPWSSAWLAGFVPPVPVEARECRNGIATVETRHSAANVAVTVLTLFIYSPVTVKVTCAVGAASSNQ